MTEQEYIDATDLVKLRIVKNILHDITPEGSKVIGEDDHRDMVVKIIEWETNIAKRMKVK